jgi:transposase, IS5 family
VVKLAIRNRGFNVRAMRCDSTVQESDVRIPTDCGLAADAVKVLARAARKVHAVIPGLTRKVRDRSRAAGRRIRELNRTSLTTGPRQRVSKSVLPGELDY